MAHETDNTEDKKNPLKKSATPLQSEDLDSVVGGARRAGGADYSGNEVKMD